MQVAFKVVSVQPDPDVEEYFTAVIRFASAAEARAFGARLDRELVVEMPDAQPPDVYELRIPAEEAEIETPPKKRGGK